MTEQWRPYDAPGDDPPPAPDEATTYPEYDAGGAWRRGRFGLLVGAIVLLGGVATVIDAISDNGNATSTTTTTTTTTTHTEIRVDGTGSELFTTAGTTAMTDALVAETGSPQVLEVILFASHALLTVRGDHGSHHLLWDGESMTPAGKAGSARRPFDLGDLDGAVVGRLCGSQPALCTAVVGRPLPGDHGAWITVTAADGVHATDLQGNEP
ncbi:hypothetical protein [Nocardioides daeguensis]|uniref:Uncharacterized protein n=1 Tax=Nocardioides daeguensis TaxID=908359 RepID=A0ABP6UQM4_9ACTN|nr:hypothetical protein [Nocardioides daeguensis]MBV6728298.1 hypothetical protein [Nocardioides daeguensis]MCR1773107.1 hypothetical protein [Nocardioides daeguensis]